MINFFQNFILIGKLNIQIQVSLIKGNLSSVGLIAATYNEEMNEYVNNKKEKNEER